MTTAPTIATRLGAAVYAHQKAECPEHVFEKAKLCLIDYLSGAFEAAPLEWSRQAAAIAMPVESGASVIAARQRAVPGEAAFANAVAAHGLVREDMHTNSIAHIGVVVWPALMATLPLLDHPVSARTFLHAGICGYEVGGRVGTALMNAELARLFRPTGMIGAQAAAVACGVLLGLDADELSVAIGLSVNTAAGFNEWPHSGGSEMYFHAGAATRNGITSALLAQQGAFAAPTIYEGEAGLFRSVGRTAPPDDIPLFVEGSFEIEDVFHKQAPACNFAQTPCQAALAAFRQTQGDFKQIAQIDVQCTQAALLYPGCDHSGPFENVLQAKMSIQYAVAAVIARNGLSEANYARPDDAQIADLIKLISLHPNDELTAAFPAKQGAEVTISLQDGQSFTARLDDVVKADRQEVEDRFARSATDWLGAEQAGKLTSFTNELMDAPDVRRLDGLCLPA